MKVLFINRMIGVSWGGGENYDYNLARGLQALGHQVVFVTASGPALQSAPFPGIEAVVVRTPYLRRFMYQLAGRAPLLPGLIAEADRALFSEAVRSLIERLVRERRIDVIQVLGLPQLASRLCGALRPTAIRFPGPPAWFLSPLLRRMHTWRNAALFSHGDAVSHFRKELGIEVCEVPPGVDGSLFEPPRDEPERRRIRSALGIAAGEIVAVTAGRLIAGKGHEFLLRALAGLAKGIEVRLVLAGDGALRGRLERLTRELGLASRVQIAGHLDRANLAGLLKSADMFCLLSDYENYSNAVLEAMSAGLPVVATRVGGFPLQVKDGVNGFLVPPGDVEALRTRIEELARSSDMRTRLGDGARRFASQFRWESTAKRVEEIYGNLLAA